MHIDEIKVHNLYMEYPDRKGFRYAGGQVTGRVSSLIEVITNKGMIGWGAAYGYPDLTRIIIENHLKSHLIGCDPCNIEELWDKMYGLTRWYGRKGIAVSSLGGLDIAFWDLKGKIAGKPIYELLGADRRTEPASVPAYASGLFWHEDVSQLEREAARHLNNGFLRVKTRLGHSEAYDIAALDAIRRGMGVHGDILVDGSHRYTVEEAERMGNILADKEVFWFEEPFPPEDIDSYVKFRPKSSVPLAAGENDFGLQGFREMLRAEALDIVQPDVCRAGGITECRRIGNLSEKFGVKVATHTWSDAVALIANAHLIASLPYGLTVEVDQTGNPFIDKLLSGPLDIRDGLLHLSGNPGLGIEIDRQVVERLTLDTMIPNGNYSDLIFGAEYLETAPPYRST